MSARVCNPVTVGMSEIAKLRTPVVGRKAISKPKSLNRVKRDLFGPVDKEESKNFIARVLADQNEILSKKWGFDFSTGQPILNHEQYQWERVPPTLAPACFAGMVTITRVAHVRPESSTTSENLLDQRAMLENGNTSHREILGSPTSDTGSSSQGTSLRKANKQRQPRITDYLQERKRPSSSASASMAKKACRMQESASSPSPMVLANDSTNTAAAITIPSTKQNRQ